MNVDDADERLQSAGVARLVTMNVRQSVQACLKLLDHDDLAVKGVGYDCLIGLRDALNDAFPPAPDDDPEVIGIA